MDVLSILLHATGSCSVEGKYPIIDCLGACLSGISCSGKNHCNARVEFIAHDPWHLTRLAYRTNV